MDTSDEATSPSDIADNELPLEIVKHDDLQTGNKPSCRKRLPRFYLLAFIPLFLFTGAVVGIYVQPPALRYFLQVTGLKPGGGTSNPIAVPVEQTVKTEPEQATIRSVVALGRLVPEGKVITISPPFGAADARIDEITIEIGSRVERGETLALLDNRASLESALASAEANVALQRTALEQTRMSIGAGLGETQAALDRAKAGGAFAFREYERMRTLVESKAVSRSDFDRASAALSQSREDITKAEATATRFTSQEMESQPDVAVAARKLDAAIADLNRAKHDLAQGIVTAPVTGTILDIYARPGEKPGAKGILDIGNVQRMTAELEVYQSEIGFIAVGQQVELTADPLTSSLFGIVSEIGFAVERQTTVRDDPAANTDARVIRVTVKLDGDSSKRAARLTNLEVTGRIAVEDSQ